jgi:hypothetical protein
MNSLPGCVSQFENLQYLNVQGMPLSSDVPNHLTNFSATITQLFVNPIAFEFGSNQGWANLVSQFPNLIAFGLRSNPPLDVAFPVSYLRSLSKLEHLDLRNNGFTGTIPLGFLDRMPNLRFLDLSGNQLSGTIPVSGWGNLEFIDVASNLFTEWPYLMPPGAPKLAFLSLVNLPLRSIPNDESFRTMTKLRELAVNQLPSLNNTRLPAFWADGSHKLEILRASDSNFQGTLPASIQSPYLRFLRARSNSLCGPLPNIAGPMGTEFIFGRNRLSGSIPSSWGSRLFVYSNMDLSDNLLEGTIPDLAVGFSFPNSISLNNNYFTGPFPNMSILPDHFNFFATGENMTFDWCAANPDWPPTVNYHLITDHSICDCTGYYYKLDLTTFCAPAPETSPPEGFPPLSPPSTRPPVIPPTYDCVTPPETPPAPISPSASPSNHCPLPSPGPTFDCVNGIWKSLGSVSQPTLTIPRPTIPGSTIIVEVGGNLTIDGDLNFDGFNTQLVINGCIFLGDNLVTIELTKEELEQLAKEGTLSKTLMTSVTGNGCSGSTDLSGTGVLAKKGSGSSKCRKVKAKNSGSTKSTLQVVFSIDNSTCNMIIIIPSVLGGILIIVVIASLVGLHIRNQKFSQKP